jgi:hypothetical protein
VTDDTWQVDWEPDPRRRGTRRQRVYLAVGGAVIALAATLALAAIARSGLRMDRALEVNTPRTPPVTERVVRWSPLQRSTRTTLALALAGEVVRLVDVDRGQVIDEVAVTPTVSDAPVFVMARVGSVNVVQDIDDVTYAFGPGARLRRLGRSWWFLPASRDRVWLVSGESFQPGEQLRVRQVDLDGAETMASSTVPPGQVPVAGRRDRLLLKDVGAMRWWLPATDAVQPSPRDVLAVSADAAVACRRGCRAVDVLDASGELTARAHTDRRVIAAALSPDGRAVALLTNAPDTLAAALSIVDLDPPAVQTIADEAPVVARRLLTWGTNDDFVFFATFDGALGVLDRRSGALHRVDVDVRGVDAMVAYDGPP